MSLMFPVYFISVVLSAGMTLLAGYQIIELSDLDCDYIDPSRCCCKLNQLVVPELLGVGLLVVLHSLTLNWIPVATTLPILAWLIFLQQSTPRGYASYFNSTDICDQKVLNTHVRRSLFKGAFHLFHFFIYMYFAIISIFTI